MKNTRTSLRYQNLRNRMYDAYADIPWQPLRAEALSHTSAVETASLLLCAREEFSKVDPELAGAAALLHDCARFLDNVPSKDHARLSAVRAEAILKEEGTWNPSEIDVITRAIASHSKKSWIGEDYSEVLKNADVAARCASGVFDEADPFVEKRIEIILNHQ